MNGTTEAAAVASILAQLALRGIRLACFAAAAGLCGCGLATTTVAVAGAAAGAASTAAGLAVEGAVLAGKGVAKAGELVVEAVQDKPAQGQAK